MPPVPLNTAASTHEILHRPGVRGTRLHLKRVQDDARQQVHPDHRKRRGNQSAQPEESAGAVMRAGGGGTAPSGHRAPGHEEQRENTIGNSQECRNDVGGQQALRDAPLLPWLVGYLIPSLLPLLCLRGVAVGHIACVYERYSHIELQGLESS